MIDVYKKNKLIIAILSGMLIGFSYPPFNLGFLIWIGFVPLIIYNFYDNNLSSKNFINFTTAFVAFSIIIHWVATNNGTSLSIAILSHILLVIYYSFFFVLMGIIFHYLNVRFKIFLFPFLFTLMEIARSVGPLAGPWLNLSLTQSNYIHYLQMVSIQKDILTFIIILANTFIAQFFITRKREWAFSFLFVIISVNLIGRLILFNQDLKILDKSVTVSIVQPSILPQDKWDQTIFEENNLILDSLSRESLSKNPDFIVWPETAITTPVSSKSVSMIFQNSFNFNGATFITGVPELSISDNSYNYFNSALVVTPERKYDFYRKIFLVPFAEYVPFFGKLVKRINRLDSLGSFSKGQEYKVFESEDLKFSVMICYDSSSPKIVQQFKKLGAEFIFILTNDAYVSDAMAHQHFLLARIRAVEQRIPIIQSGNHGISGVILSTGKILTKTNLFERKTLTAQVFY